MKRSELIRKLERAGCIVCVRRGGHLAVQLPNGSTRFTSSTPSDYRAWKNFLSVLRRNGVEI